jgi:hypothetical protein
VTTVPKNGTIGELWQRADLSTDQSAQDKGKQVSVQDFEGQSTNFGDVLNGPGDCNSVTDRGVVEMIAP